MAMHSKDSLHDEVMDLLHKRDDASAARRLVKKALLSASGGRRKLRHRSLLDLLVIIEISSRRTAAAIEALTERQSLGFTSFATAFDAASLKASLLMDSGKWCAARAEVALSWRTRGPSDFYTHSANTFEQTKICADEWNRC